MRLNRFPLCLALLIAFPRWSEAQPSPSSEQAELLRAVTHAPALKALSRRAAAARERVDAAGRLADVEVEGMGSRMVGPRDERSTMWEVTVRQPLPKRGERVADRERARAAVSLAEADYSLMAGEMAADTAIALAEAEGAQARIRLLETQMGRLDAVLRSIEARIASGGGRLADRLIVQTRLAAMQLMIEEERRATDDALAEARGRLGLQIDTPLPAFAAPTLADVNVDEAAALRVAAARTDEANALVKMARASASPMTALGIRFEQEQRTMGDETTLGFAFMSEIPWRSRRYARAEVRAAEAERAAAQTDATAARYRISAALSRVVRAERLAATARRISEETIGRLAAEHDAMTRGSSVGTPSESTILHTVEILEKITEAELQVIRADTAVRTARAELWRHVPAGRFIAGNN